MQRAPDIRAGGRDDLPALESLYPEAFPDEDLLPLSSRYLGDAEAAAAAAEAVAKQAG